MATRKWKFFVSLFEILRPRNAIELNCYHRSEQWHRYSLLKTFNLSLKRILRWEIRLFLLSLLCRCKIVNFNDLQAVNSSFLVELIKFHHLNHARQVEISSERDIHNYFVTFWKSFQWLSIKDTTTLKQQQLTVEWRHKYEWDENITSFRVNHKSVSWVNCDYNESVPFWKVQTHSLASWSHSFSDDSTNKGRRSLHSVAILLK